MLLALFSSSTSSGSGNSCNGRSDGMSGNSKYSSSHNTIYGTVLHPTSTVFTPHVRHLYSTLAPFYQDQILVSVRFALMGLAQELAVQPALTYTMHSAYKTADYGSIRKGREEWYRQREVLRRSIGRSSSRGDDGNVDERPNVGSVGSVVSTDATVDISGSTIPNTTHSTASTSTTSTTSTNTTTPLPTVHTHYVTYGSDLTEGLQNLLDSAQLAGVAIEVCRCSMIVVNCTCFSSGISHRSHHYHLVDSISFVINQHNPRPLLGVGPGHSLRRLHEQNGRLSELSAQQHRSSHPQR